MSTASWCVAAGGQPGMTAGLWAALVVFAIGSLTLAWSYVRALDRADRLVGEAAALRQQIAVFEQAAECVQ